MLKDCLKTHPLLHTLTGIGVGLVIVALLPDLVANALVLGIILIVVGLVLEMMGKQK